MIKEEKKKIYFSPSKQEKLFFYKKKFNYFIELYEKKLLPNRIILNGQAGIGKCTFAYHFINFVLSKHENNSYDIENFKIKLLNKSFRLVNQNCHPNFFLIENSEDKSTIDVKQIRNMINYTNKTTYNNEVKFILIDNAEYLNAYSLNALLKTVEEATPKTFFIFINNYSKKLAETLRSRCIEFKFFFTREEKTKIFENLINYFDLGLYVKNLECITSLYDSPGTLLNVIKLYYDNIIDLKKDNSFEIIDDLMRYSLSNKNNYTLNLLQSLIEISFFNKLKKNADKNKILYDYSKNIKKFNFFRKYNLDMNNTFYEIKENIIHG